MHETTKVVQRVDDDDPTSPVAQLGYDHDARGYHVTFACKTTDQVINNTHISGHAYIRGRADFELTDVDLFGEKPDDTMRQRKDKEPLAIWPEGNGVVLDTSVWE